VCRLVGKVMVLMKTLGSQFRDWGICKELNLSLFIYLSNILCACIFINLCVKVFYSYGLFNSNCRETIKDFVTRGYNSKILPLPVSLFYLGLLFFFSYSKFLVILHL
jgi:Na+/proline symporter